MARTGARIDTERLILRPPEARDAAAIQRQVEDPAVALLTANIPHPYPPDGAREWIGRTREGAHRFVFERRADGALVGAAGLVAVAPGVAELGYWVGREHWRRGYATEAGAALTAWGFAQLGLSAIEAGARPDNAASIRVQEKLGMTLDREEDRPLPARGMIERLPIRRVTFEAWAAAHPAPVVLVSAVALIDRDGRVLLAQRPEGKAMAGLWEFPGGKVADGESPESALIRELAEELGIDVTAACLAPLTFASHRYEAFHLLMPLYVCRKWQGIARPLEGQTLKWVRPAKLEDYPMPPADGPLLQPLRDLLL